MPITTNLDVAPYYDDYDPANEYYRILFKPSVAVQTRELNQLQAILQNQIEQFGNNIYRRGTIINGCNFVFFDNYPYAKLLDKETDGTLAAPALYVGHFARNPTNNLRAQVINSADGYESQDPNLNTIYMRYINSGTSGNLTSFSSGDTIVIYDSNNSLSKTSITNGSTGWANTDTVVIVPAILANLTSSTAFSNGETITQSTTNSRAVINGIDTTTIPGKSILSLKPVQTDLTNTSVSLAKWQFVPGYSILGGSSGAAAGVDEIIGAGATASIITDSTIGAIQNLSIINGGSNYYVPPYVTIRQNYTTGGNYGTLALIAYNYISQIKIASTANAIGNGYAFGVTSGVIYKNGYFLNVDPQTTVVSMYNSYPNNVSIGFGAVETIVDYNADTNLLDNSTGTPNSMAPGADRLKIKPVLVVSNTDIASTNTDFLSIVEFSEGYPYKQNRVTQYNAIEDEMALRTAESAGDYVTDRFLTTTKSPANTSLDANTYTIVVDPGTAYVSGFRVSTLFNYAFDNIKAIDYSSSNGSGINVSYENYVDISQVAGTFMFSTGDSIDLYDKAYGYLSNTAAISAGTIPPSGYSGNKIGTANIRQMLHVSGTPGFSGAVYRLYLFNLNMIAGANFSSVKGINYNGTVKGVADVLLAYNASSNTSIANLVRGINGVNKMLFNTGTKSTLAVSNLNYLYRTVNNGITLSNTGSLQISLLSSPNEVFQYVGGTTLTFDQKNDIIITPLNAGLRITPDLAGTANVTSAANNADGTSNVYGTSTVFASATSGLIAGDYVYFYANSTVYDIKKVTAVVNNSFLYVDSKLSFSNSAASMARYFPKNVAIPLSSPALQRDNFVANVNTNGTILTVSLNVNTTATSAANVSVVYNVNRNGVAADAKTANRDSFVKIRLANNAAGINGPWCLGVPDIFRLKNVYLADNSNVSTSSSDVTNEFYIDHNQNEDFYDLGYIHKKSTSSLSLSTTNWLLVQFDASTTAGSLHTVSSYVSANLSTRFSTDSSNLSSIGSSYNTLEIPEMYASSGRYYDLIDQIDFRPSAVNTAVITSNAAAANVNPVYSLSFGSYTSDKKFPVPGSGVTFNQSHFLGRRDNVIVDTTGKISLVKGQSAEGTRLPNPRTPSNTMVISNVVNPPYPSIPLHRSTNLNNIINTRIATEKYSFIRSQNHSITTNYVSNRNSIQPIAYTMRDIGTLEKRIRALEYYTGLTMLETSIKDTTIPSSISPSINRFKFGFFTDTFSNYSFTDINNVEYNARVSNGMITPADLPVLINHTGNNKITYIQEYSVVSQNIATGATKGGIDATIYNGVAVSVDPDTLVIPRYDNKNALIWYGQKVSIKMKSLKPLTKHSIYLDDKLLSNSAILLSSDSLPASTSVSQVTDQVQTDASGSANFFIMINIDEYAYNNLYKNTNVNPTKKVVLVKSSDNSSVGAFSLPATRLAPLPPPPEETSNGLGDNGRAWDNRGPENNSQDNKTDYGFANQENGLGTAVGEGDDT